MTERTSDNKPKCVWPGCVLFRCIPQNTPFCFSHAMLCFAQTQIAIINPAHADDALRNGIRHFARGFVVGNHSTRGLYYYVPAWEFARVN